MGNPVALEETAMKLTVTTVSQIYKTKNEEEEKKTELHRFLDASFFSNLK